MDAQHEAAIGTWPTPERPVRITIPAAVAFDIGKLQKSLVGIAERLGCRSCFSGSDCTFILERNFVIDPETLGVRSVGSVVITHG